MSNELSDPPQGHSGDPASSEGELPPPPPEVRELADACVSYVERATGMKLDYEVETLPILDHYVRGARGDVGVKPEMIAILAAPVGAYLGEVARRRMPLHWFAPPGEYRRWRIELENVFLSMNPIGAAFEAITLSDSEGWGAHFRLRPEDERKAAAVLANLPEVEEDEYYAPSSRLETLGFVVDALVSENELHRTYGPADYGPFRTEAIGEALDKGDGTH